MQIQLFSAFILLCFWACQSPAPAPQPILAPVDTIFQSVKIAGEPNLLLVSGNVAILRNQPDINGVEIARFAFGDSLLFFNELSPYTLELKLDGIIYDEPWLLVSPLQQPDKKGWVFAGSVRFVQPPSAELQSLTMARRIDKILGKGWNQKLVVYNQELLELRTAVAFEMVWRRGETLKKGLAQRINDLYQQSANANKNNFGWINDIFQGYQLYWIAEKDEFALYRNLSVWLPKTIQTADTTDEKFLHSYLQLYANDSSEFWHSDLSIRKNPADTLLYSLLGRNLHQNILSQTKNYPQDSLFRPHYVALRKQIIDDILLCDRFWLPIETVRAELETILSNPTLNLYKNERISLEARLAVLQNYTANGVIANGIESE